MPVLEVINLKKEKVGKVELSDAVFGVEVNVPLVHQIIKAQRAGRRQGTHKTKSKGEVRGGGKKPYRQKGTGNARRGSSRSPLIVGGGVAFGPRPRKYDQSTPKKMVMGALRSALTDRVKSDRLLVLDEMNFAKPTTKTLAEAFSEKLELKNVLVVDIANKNLELSLRNIPNVKYLPNSAINVYDVVAHEWLVLTKKAAEEIDARLGVNA